LDYYHLHYYFTEKIDIMNGYKQNPYTCNIKRYVQVLDLTDDHVMISEYNK